MSGDVQPRKRRDKKKKKDELEETISPPHFARAPTPPTTNNDDVNIHVYKESSTGGGICAKLVFFVLLAILATLIGLIITEHRGLTDLDTIEQETRFSQLFEGWVDKTPDDHDDHGAHPIESHEHDEEEHDDHDEDDHGDEHDEEEEEHEEEEEEEQVSEEEEAAASTEEEAEESVQEDEEEPSAQEDEDEPSVQEDEEDDEEELSAQDDESVQNDVSGTQEESEQQDESAQNEDEDEDAEGSEAEEDEPEAASEEKSVETGTEDDEEDTEQPADDEEEGDEANAEDGADDEEATNIAVAIRVGVGLTILVVAYVVLVKKWKSDKDEDGKEAAVDLSRRNTIVVPPKVEEVEQVIDNDDEEYSEDEIEEEVKLHPKVKQDYQKLRSTYERSLTPESEPDLLRKGKYDYDDEDEEDVDYDEEEAEDEEGVEEEEEEEGEEEELEPASEEEEELMKKFEAKYGKIGDEDEDVEEEEVEEEYDEEEEEEDDDDPRYKYKPKPAQTYDSDDDKDAWLSGGAQSAPEYAFENITNADDNQIKNQLDEAEDQFENNAALAVSLFNKILETRPYSPRALYGKAKSLDNLADRKRSNDMLKESIASYMEVLKLGDVPPVLFVMAADRSINRLRFLGHYGRAASVHKLLIQRFPKDIKYRNDMAVTYLTSNRITEARDLLQETLSVWPNDGFALVHYGFILKVNDQKLEEGIRYMQRGLSIKAEGVTNGIFYFHLGDALTRIGKTDEALKVYSEGVKNKVFLSKYQRSLYNVDRLTGRPWWKKQNFPTSYQKYYDILERNYRLIKSEGLAVLNLQGFFQDEVENLRDVGDWKQFELYARGVKHKENCKKCPITCKIIENIPEAAACRRGQIKFSVMHPGTHVWPHCGPTNCRLRMHLGLKVPPETYIRVATETKSWEEGKVFVFDDSFEHEVWHNGTEFRLVLIVDVWHPELTANERRSLSAI